jgi:hypothetical protein
MAKKHEGKDKIISLANRLIKAINEQGLSVMNPDISKGFGAFDINVHNYGTNTAIVEVNKICENGGNKFEFKGKPEEGIK